MGVQGQAGGAGGACRERIEFVAGSGTKLLRFFSGMVGGNGIFSFTLRKAACQHR